MKRKIFAATLVFVTILTAVFATGCHKVDALKDCNFSVDNIVEMRYSSSPYYESKNGNIFAIDSETGEEEKFAVIAKAWKKLSNEDFFAGEMLIPTVTGGTSYFECKFKDGSTVKITLDSNKNIFFDDSKKSYRIKDFDAMLDFKESCKVIVDESERYLIGYIKSDVDEDANASS